MWHALKSLCPTVLLRVYLSVTDNEEHAHLIDYNSVHPSRILCLNGMLLLNKDCSHICDSGYCIVYVIFLVILLLSDFLARCFQHNIIWSSAELPYSGCPHVIIGRQRLECRYGPLHEKKKDMSKV